MSPTRVLLVRHGQSTWNAEGRWQGWADVPLSKVGEDQARAAANHLPDVEAVVSSDLLRAQRTAQLLVEGRGLPPVETIRGLRERSVGDFEGLTNSEIAARFGGIESDENGRPLIPGGERNEKVLARALRSLRSIARRHPGQAVLAISHGGIIRTLEEYARCPVGPVPNLAGRWFEVRGNRVLAADRVRLFDRDEAPVTIPRQL